jgi:hypothetical protein
LVFCKVLLYYTTVNYLHYLYGGGLTVVWILLRDMTVVVDTHYSAISPHCH